MAPAESIIRPKTSEQESYRAPSASSELEMHKGEEQVTNPAILESEQQATVEGKQASTADDESKGGDQKDYVIDEYGKRRRRQRVEVEKGHFYEFTAVNKNKGKFFVANTELIPVDEAIGFPELSATSLTGQNVEFPACFTDRVSLVGIFHRQFGFTMLPSWVEPFEEAFGLTGSTSGGPSREVPTVLQLSLLESWVLRFLRPVMVMSMGRSLPPEKKGGFCYRFGNTDELRGHLEVVNRLTLDVFLVDKAGRIRWRGSGKSTHDEVDSLIRCARELMNEESVEEIAEAGSGYPGRRGRRRR